MITLTVTPPDCCFASRSTLHEGAFWITAMLVFGIAMAFHIFATTIRPWL